MTARPELRPFVELGDELRCMGAPDGRLIWWNAAFEQAIGHGRVVVADPDKSPFVHPDDRTVARTAWAGLRGGEALRGIRLRHPRAAGGWSHIEWAARVHPTTGRMYAVGRDVTDHQALLEALHTSRAWLQSILDHSPAMVFVKDLDWRYVMVNGEWSRVMGVAPEDAIGRTAAELTPWYMRSLGEFEQQLPFDEGPLVIDQAIDTAIGRRVVMASRFQLRSSAGQPYATVCIATDITERKRLEREADRRQRLLETVMAASPDVISILDRTGHTTSISAAGEEVLGRRLGPGLGEWMFDLVHPEDLPRVADAFADLSAGITPEIAVRARIRHVDGHWVASDVRCRTIVDDDGSFAGAVVVSRDMSGKLEHERRLRAAIAAAEQASQAKSEFLSRMSHELRTPLNAVLGFSQLLQMDELPATEADEVDYILRSGRHLLDLIDGVLDIARIESGRLELEVTPVQVAEVVADATGIAQPLAERAGIFMEVTVDDRLLVQADRHRLLQVLLNLLSNAVKYNQRGGRIRVRCLPVSAGRLRLEVTDTGRGILAEDLRRVFEPFERLGVGQAEGTGVGLALSKHLVERMGGRLTADSLPGEGSTFAIELPVATDRPRIDVLGPGGLLLEPGPAADFMVLLVEDNLANLELVERVLARRPGVQVLAAMQGGLALELAREHQPDLVLLDLHLPDMGGVDVLRALRSDPSTAGVAVAVVSADAPSSQSSQLHDLGVVAMLAKPLDVRVLLALVDDVRAAAGGQAARRRLPGS